MPFTDDDLKRWHKELSEWNARQSISYFKINNDEMTTLLARLEAAENVIKEFRIPEDIPMGVIERWCKAAGK